MSTEILKQKNPALAQLVERWQTKYGNRVYDLTSIREQADFYEGVLEMAKHMAAASSTGRLELTVSSSGPSGLKLDVVPVE